MNTFIQRYLFAGSIYAAWTHWWNRDIWFAHSIGEHLLAGLMNIATWPVGLATDVADEIL